MKKDTKSTCEIDIIDLDGNHQEDLIPSLEFFKQALLRASRIPFLYFDNKNEVRKRKISKIVKC